MKKYLGEICLPQCGGSGRVRVFEALVGNPELKSAEDRIAEAVCWAKRGCAEHARMIPECGAVMRRGSLQVQNSYPD